MRCRGYEPWGRGLSVVADVSNVSNVSNVAHLTEGFVADVVNVSAMIEVSVTSSGCQRDSKQAGYVESVHDDGRYCKGR